MLNCILNIQYIRIFRKEIFSIMIHDHGMMLVSIDESPRMSRMQCKRYEVGSSFQGERKSKDMKLRDEINYHFRPADFRLKH